MAIDQATLGAAIKAVRMARHLTQSQLANRIGFSSGGIALIEQGKRSVSMATLNAIASVLKIPPACLAILGSRGGGKSKPVDDFLESLKHLVSTLIAGQQLAAEKSPNSSARIPTKKTARRPLRRRTEIAQLAATPSNRPAKGKPSRSGNHKVAAGR